MIVGTSPTIKINSDLFLAQVVSTPLEQLSVIWRSDIDQHLAYYLLSG